MAASYQTEFSKWCWTDDHYRTYTNDLVKMLHGGQVDDNHVTIREMMSTLFRKYKPNNQASNPAIKIDDIELTTTKEWNLWDLFNDMENRLPQFYAVVQDSRTAAPEEEEDLFHRDGSSEDEVGTDSRRRRATKAGDDLREDVQISDLMAQLESLRKANKALTAENKNIREDKRAEIARLNKKIEDDFHAFTEDKKQLLELRQECEEKDQHNVCMSIALKEARSALSACKTEKHQLKESLRTLKVEHHKTIQTHKLEKEAALAVKDAEHSLNLKKQLDAAKADATKPDSSPSVRAIGGKSPSRGRPATPVGLKPLAVCRDLKGALEGEPSDGPLISVSRVILDPPTPLRKALNDTPGDNGPAADELTVDELIAAELIAAELGAAELGGKEVIAEEPAAEEPAAKGSASAPKSPTWGEASMTSSTSEEERVATQLPAPVVEDKGDTNSAASGKSDNSYNKKAILEAYAQNLLELQEIEGLLKRLLFVDVAVVKAKEDKAVLRVAAEVLVTLGSKEDAPVNAEQACKNLSLLMFVPGASHPSHGKYAKIAVVNWRELKKAPAGKRKREWSYGDVRAMMFRLANIIVGESKLLQHVDGVRAFDNLLAATGEEYCESAHVIAMCTARNATACKLPIAPSLPFDDQANAALEILHHGAYQKPKKSAATPACWKVYDCAENLDATLKARYS